MFGNLYGHSTALRTSMVSFIAMDCLNQIVDIVGVKTKLVIVVNGRKYAFTPDLLVRQNAGASVVLHSINLSYLSVNVSFITILLG